MPHPERCLAESSPASQKLMYFGVGLLLLMGIARAMLFLGMAFLEIPVSDPLSVLLTRKTVKFFTMSSDQRERVDTSRAATRIGWRPCRPAFNLEGANVSFAWRVERNLPLYPQQTDTSFAVNYMGPVYYWTVGFLGRLFYADIPQLFIIGRVVTFFCAMVPAVIAAWFLYRCYGRFAGLVGFVFGMGSGPINYWVMTRPDMMADMFGAAGFFLLLSPERLWNANDENGKRALPDTALHRCGPGRFLTAAMLLAAGCLTKQTAVVWLMAAVLVLLFQRGMRIRAFLLGGMTVATVGTVIAMLATTIEPFIIPSLLSQSGTGFDLEQQLGILMLLTRRSPEMLFFVFVGCGLWASREAKNRSLLILGCLTLFVAVVTCAKKGSDLNYFLSLRMIEAIAAGTIVALALQAKESQQAKKHVLQYAFLAITAAVLVVPSTLQAATSTILCYHQIGLAREYQQQFRSYVHLAEDPETRLFTDSDRLAVYQGDRAAFLDCYLFRLQVEAGVINPQKLIDCLQTRWYRYVILSADINREHADNFFHALPEPMVDAIRANYELQSWKCGLYVYVPRDAAIKQADDEAANGIPDGPATHSAANPPANLTTNSAAQSTAPSPAGSNDKNDMQTKESIP